MATTNQIVPNLHAPILIQNGQNRDHSVLNNKEISSSPHITERKLPSIRKAVHERRKSMDISQQPAFNLDINASNSFTKSYDSKKRERPSDPDIGKEFKQKLFKLDTTLSGVQPSPSPSPALNVSNGGIPVQLPPLKKSSSSVNTEAYKSHHDILRKHNEEQRIKLAKGQAVQSVQHRPALYVGIESFCGNLIVPILPTYLVDEKNTIQPFSFEEA